MKASDLPPYEEPPEPYERRNPLDRFAHVPIKTREWLEGLREQDIEELEDMRKLFRTFNALGTFGKWVLYTIVAATAAGVAFGENLLKFIGMFRGSH